MRDFYPLIFVFAYLFLTTFLYVFGPVQFRTHNSFIFYSLLFFYLFSFFYGYYLSFLLNKKKKINFSPRAFSTKLYYTLLIFGTLVLIVNYKNLMLNESFIPYDFFNDFLRGVTEPGLVYTERMSKISSGFTSNSRFFNILLIFLSFTKLLFIFYFVYYWSVLSVTKRFFSYFYSFLFLSCGISSGTNSFVFIFFIFLMFSLLVRYLIFNPRKLKRI